MDARSAGLLLVAVGLAVAVVGLLVATGALSWLGRLPGDIRYESERTRVYVPITSMVIASLAVSALLWLLRR